VALRTGRILRLGLLTLVVTGLGVSTSAAAPGADPAAPLFDPREVVEVEFTLSPESRAALDSDPDTYVPADLVIDSAAGSYDDTVGLRLKGSTSFRTLDGKAAFKVKFKEFGGAKFLDLKKLTLNNMVQDPSMLRETIVYELFRELGVPAPRTGYAYVRVNGDDYGVYLNVETMDDVSLPLWFESTSHLYEGGNRVDVRSEDVDEYEVDEGDEDDRSDLQALIAAVDATGSSFSARVSGLVDLDEMVREWAVEKYSGAWDVYTTRESDRGPNNYYLHSDAGGRFSMIPWGNDTALLVGLPFDGPGGRLFEGCRTDPQCFERFREVLGQIPGAVTQLGLVDEVAELAAMLEPWQQLDPRREHSTAEIAEAVDDLREFLELRPNDLYDPAYWAAGPPLSRPVDSDPPTTGPVDDPVEAADGEAPDTSFTRVPAATVKTKHPRVVSRFRFESSEAGSSFECRTDSGSWHRCSSPERTNAPLGQHVFRVRATDAAGNVDPSPARHRWLVRSR
jgi:hypothetical protein